ncbi:golgin subfamily A member 6-like protein 22 [Cucurbita moschata]|uniref:Golgin subfamily A member 6-like protein 22 n=1 Tax=Cucurbita moschata TaxID=3662 RepID=A0A6J1G6H6_CUCMO|nr:golgin subfamily A member 6-like protein 22 [Cucurbita moschata]
MGVVAGVHSKLSNSRGRPYALMLLVAFGAALLGVMLLHKFRERRICNLLLKRTDEDLHSFQLLFQKERDRSKELEKNNEDIKESMFLLRTQKMELDRRLLELQSTIDSLRDEQKIIRIALQEKQSEIKMLREKETENGNENSQVVVLTQRLKQKEDELEDLRRRLKSRGAVAANDPSDPHEDSIKIEEQSEILLESMKNNRGESKPDFSEGSTSKRDETETETETQKSEETPERREKEGAKVQKQVSSEDDGEESKITNDHKGEEGNDSEAIENQRADKILNDGMKMKTETGKYGHTRKMRGKRWRYIAKKRSGDNGWRLISKKRKQENNRNLEDSVATSTTNRKFIKGGTFNEEKMKEYPEEAREEENKRLKEEELNRESNSDVGDDSIKQNPDEENELKVKKSEEKQEQEQDDDGHFNRESNSHVGDDVKEETNKEETEDEF